MNASKRLRSISPTTELHHLFVTPEVTLRLSLSGFAILAGAESVLKTTPLYILGLIVPHPSTAAFILIVASVLE